MLGSGTRVRTRGRLIGALAASALAVGLVALPATPASAVVCKVNAMTNPTTAAVQGLLDNPAIPVVSFSGSCLMQGFTLSRNVTVTGTTGAEILPYAGNYRHFWVDPGVTATISNLKLVDGWGNEGGAIYVDNSAVVTVRNVTFDGGYVYNYGGAIYADANSTVTVINSRFLSNYAEDSGGAIASINSRLSITGSTFTDNVGGWAAPGFGGAIFATRCWDGGVILPAISITKSVFARNSAQGGGAIWLNATPATITSGTFTANTATGNDTGGAGGAIRADDYGCDDADVGLSIATSTFTSNSSSSNFGYGYGGALAVISNGQLSIANSKFTSNLAQMDGGAITSAYQPLSITGSTFTANKTNENGGALEAVGGYGEDVNILRTTFSANSAPFGGGGAAYLMDGLDISITSSTFSKNSAASFADLHNQDSGGGALYVGGSDLTMTSTTVAENSAAGNGGGIFWEPWDCEELVLTSTTLRKNVTKTLGGGLYAYGDMSINSIDGTPCVEVVLDRSLVTGNVATLAGGGVYMDGYAYDPDADPEGMEYFDSGTLRTDELTKIDANTAGKFGGGIYAEDFSLVLSGSVSGNKAGLSGGGIYVEEGWREDIQVSLSDIKVDRNAAVVSGGGIMLDGNEADDTDYPYFNSYDYGHISFFVTDDLGPVSISYNRVTGPNGEGGGIWANEVKDFLMVTPNYAYDGVWTIRVEYNSAKGWYPAVAPYDDQAAGITVFWCAWDEDGSCYLDYGAHIANNNHGGLYDACNFGGSDATIENNIGFDTDYDYCL